MEDDDVLRIRREGPVAYVTLNRPDVHNAFDEHLIAALTDAYLQLGADDNIRVVVLGGEGTSFCAGADLNWMARMAGFSYEENIADARILQRMMAAVAECPKITIARVHGNAFGGGVGLIVACDVAVAAASTSFAFSEVRLGLVPAVISPYVLQRVTAGAARSLFVTGRRFGADEALRIGLLQEVAPDGELDAAVERLIGEALAAAPEAVARTKRLLREIAGQTPEQAADATVKSIAEARASEEARERVRGFLEKRKSPHPPTPFRGQSLTPQPPLPLAGEGEPEGEGSSC